MLGCAIHHDLQRLTLCPQYVKAGVLTCLELHRRGVSKLSEGISHVQSSSSQYHENTYHYQLAAGSVTYRKVHLCQRTSYVTCDGALADSRSALNFIFGTSSNSSLSTKRPRRHVHSLSASQGLSKHTSSMFLSRGSESQHRNLLPIPLG